MITHLSLEHDLPEIEKWDKEMVLSQSFETIRHFIMEDKTYYSIAEVIDTNYEKYEIGDNEKKFAFVIRTKDEIMGFVLALLSGKKTDNPELMIQYIVLHPDYQKQGIGKSAIRQLITDSNIYFGTNVDSVFARLDKENYASKRMFDKIGFTFLPVSNNYLQATFQISENNKE